MSPFLTAILSFALQIVWISAQEIIWQSTMDQTDTTPWIATDLQLTTHSNCPALPCWQLMNNMYRIDPTIGYHTISLSYQITPYSSATCALYYNVDNAGDSGWTLFDAATQDKTLYENTSNLPAAVDNNMGVGIKLMESAGRCFLRNFVMTGIPITDSPTGSPTKNPSKSPSRHPSVSPTKHPTTTPTRNPTDIPSQSPTKFPTGSPSQDPTAAPSRDPSFGPTLSPNPQLNVIPTHPPTKSPLDEGEQPEATTTAATTEDDGEGNQDEDTNDNSQAQVSSGIGANSTLITTCVIGGVLVCVLLIAFLFYREKKKNDLKEKELELKMQTTGSLPLQHVAVSPSSASSVLHGVPPVNTNDSDIEHDEDAAELEAANVNLGTNGNVANPVEGNAEQNETEKQTEMAAMSRSLPPSMPVQPAVPAARVVVTAGIIENSDEEDSDDSDGQELYNNNNVTTGQ